MTLGNSRAVYLNKWLWALSLASGLYITLVTWRITCWHDQNFGVNVFWSERADQRILRRLGVIDGPALCAGQDASLTPLLDPTVIPLLAVFGLLAFVTLAAILKVFYIAQLWFDGEPEPRGG